jgi:CARDB protein
VRTSVTCVTLCLAALGSLPSPARSQDSLTTEYAVKVVCGAPDRRQLAPGTYFTAINIHNPGGDSLVFRKKFALTLPGEQPGRVYPFSSNGLLPDQALEIDCTDVFRRTHTAGFAKGFAIIQSPRPLDIVAVYAAAGSTGRVEALELERVPGRRLGLVRGCPDLVVDSILRPTWDAANNRSVIVAVIRNSGTTNAPSTIARVIDPSTTGPTGAPQNAIATTPPLAPGAAASVTFYLPYWVFNPDASLEVTADYKNDLLECREDNNVASYSAIG